MEKETEWKIVPPQSPLKATYQIDQVQDKTKLKLIAGDIPDLEIANLFVDMPMNMAILRDFLDYCYARYESDYKNFAGDKTESNHIFKHVHYLHCKVGEFERLFGKLPRIYKTIADYKPILSPIT